MARLLRLGIEAEPGGQAAPDDSKAEMLRAVLCGTGPLDSAAADAIPVILGRLKKELLGGCEQTLGEALLGAFSELPQLEQIKNYGKRLAAIPEDEVVRAVGTAIYYGAIASALLLHRKKMTQHSYEALVEAFGVLRDKPWMPGEMARHFAKARRHCEEAE